MWGRRQGGHRGHRRGRACSGRSIGEGRREGSAPLSPCEWRRQEENEGEKGSRGGGFEREEGDGIRRCGGARGIRGREAGLAFEARVRKGLGGLDLQANGPAWLDRPKRPAGLLFSLSYSFFHLPTKQKKRKKRKRR